MSSEHAREISEHALELSEHARDVMEDFLRGASLPSETREHTKSSSSHFLVASEMHATQRVPLPEQSPCLVMQPSIFDAWLKLQRSHSIKLMSFPGLEAPSAKWMDTSRFFKPSFVGLVPALVTPQCASPPMPEPGAVSLLAAKRLRLTCMMKTDDQVKWEALKKFKAIVLDDPDGSKLGRCLVSAVRFLQSEQQWECSFNDAFEGKSTATLVKRSASLWRFKSWCEDNRVGAIIGSSESTVYRYMQFLKEHGAPTTATSFLQAWTFLRHQIGLLGYPLEDILSSRVRGAARAMLSEKRVLQQAAPLSVKMIVALENVANFAPYPHWRIIAGHFLLCLGSCSRFGDSIHLHKLEVTFHESLELVEAESKSFKTGLTEERKKSLLPLLSLGRFLGRQAWRGRRLSWVWIHHCRLIRRSATRRRMTTGEAYLYLHEFLLSSGFKADTLDGVGCHSLKVTLLSWASKGNYLPVADRLLLGHHLSRDSQSAVTYARDELTRLQTTVHKMFYDVRHHVFKPDASRAERPAMNIAGEETHQGEESEDDIVEGDIGRTPASTGVSTNWNGVTLDVLKRLRIHLHSGVVHVISEADCHRFKCGRKHTQNFDEIPADTNYADLPACKQCRP